MNPGIPEDAQNDDWTGLTTVTTNNEVTYNQSQVHGEFGRQGRGDVGLQSGHDKVPKHASIACRQLAIL